MRKLPLFVCLLAGAVVIAVAAGWILLRGEPRYDGRSLGSWLADLDPDVPEHNQKRAAEALRHLGTNAVPVLVRMIQEREPAKPTLRQELIHLLSRQSLVRIKIDPDGDVHWRAARGFEALGPAGESALPALIKLFRDEPSRPNATAAIVGIGKPAVRPLMLELVHSDSRVRAEAVRALGAIGAEPDLAVPALLARVEDSDRSVRSDAIRALGEFGHSAASAVPLLTRLLTNQHDGIDAAFALGGIGGEAETLLLSSLHHTNRPTKAGASAALSFYTSPGYVAATNSRTCDAYMRRMCEFNTRALKMAWLLYSKKEEEMILPALTLKLQSSNAAVRLQSARAAGEFGAKVRTVVPVLLTLLHDADAQVRETAREALERIDPEAAAMARPK